jgi:hypothetical protein
VVRADTAGGEIRLPVVEIGSAPAPVQ